MSNILPLMKCITCLEVHTAFILGGQKMMNFDLCVIGAGMMGSAAARYASANPSLKVCLVGPEEPVESEWQHRSIFSSHYDEGRITRILDENPFCQILCKYSISKYRELERLSGINFYDPVGFMLIGNDSSPYIQKSKQTAILGNINLLDLSFTDLMEKRFPYIQLKPGEKAFLHEEGAGHFSPRKMVEAQKKVASIQGCKIIPDVVTEVKPMIETLKESYHEIITETGVIIRTKRVLICTGAFTNFNNLIPKYQNMVPDITVDRETVALLKLTEAEAFRLRSMPTTIYSQSDGNITDYITAYILPPIQYPDGHWYLKIGHINEIGKSLKTLEEIKRWYLSDGDQEIIKSHSKLLCDMLPGLQYLDVKGATCVSCHSPNGLPYIDRITPTITVAIVGNGKGAKFSDEVGRIAAELSISGNWNSEIPQSVFRVYWKYLSNL